MQIKSSKKKLILKKLTRNLRRFFFVINNKINQINVSDNNVFKKENCKKNYS